MALAIPSEVTGFCEPCVGVESKVSTFCLSANCCVSSALVGSPTNFCTNMAVMPLLMAIHCASVKLLLANEKSICHALPS